MSDQFQLLKRAARLFAPALKAREEGHLDYAERLIQRASGILDHPTALERLGTQSGQRLPERSTQTGIGPRPKANERPRWLGPLQGNCRGRSARCAIALIIEDKTHWSQR